MEEVFDAFGRGDIWGALQRTLGAALAGFYGLVPVYGISIILLTMAVRMLVWPLTSKQAKSMYAMQKVQPEIKKIQQKYKGDRQRLNEELMKFYQENRINPLASCLPLVVQAPILFAMFRVFAPPGGGGHFLREVGALAGGAPGSCAGLIPQGAHGLIPSGTALRHSLDCNRQTFLGMDLARRPADFINVFPDFIPYLLLVALVVVSGIFSSRQMMKRTPAASQNPQMRIIGQVMPIFFGFITYTLSSGLGVYFAVSNLWQVGQQEMIFRQRQRADEEEKRRKARGEPPRPPRRSLFGLLTGAAAQARGDGNGAGTREPSTPRPARERVSSEEEAPAPRSSRPERGENQAGPGRKPAAGGDGSRSGRQPAKGTGGGSRPASPQRSGKKRKKKGR